MSFTAKSVIFDIADNHGGSLIDIRSIDFWLSGSKITVNSTTCTCYATSQYNTQYLPIYAFDTSKSKTGDWNYNSWAAASGNTTNQRLIIVFDTATEFDTIKINNAHHNGLYTDSGINNVVINFSTDAITDTTYNAAISNSTLIYNGTFAQHTASNVEDEQTLVLTTGDITYTVTYDGNTNDSGTVPTDATAYSEGDTVTVLGNTGSLAKTGYTFAGWNTAANGTGTTYAPNATFLMGNANVTLYAVWTEDSILPVLYLGATKITKIYKGATEITNFIRT